MLESPHGAMAFHHTGDVHTFDGETAVVARLGRGPACLWNLMFDRQRFDGHLYSRLGMGCRWSAAPLAAVLVLDGRMVAVADRAQRARLSPQQCLVLTDLMEPLTLVAEDGPAHWAMAWVTKRG